MRRCRDTGQERMPVARGLSREAAGLQPRQSVTIPPLTRRSCPVIPRASSLTKSATTSARFTCRSEGAEEQHCSRLRGWRRRHLLTRPSGEQSPGATRPGTYDLRRSFWSAAQHRPGRPTRTRSESMSTWHRSHPIRSGLIDPPFPRLHATGTGRGGPPRW